MKHLRRAMLFIATRLVIIVLCVSLLICAFYMAYSMGNAYILVTEGLEKRAEVCIYREGYTDLNKYFTVSFLNSDPVLAVSVSEQSPYLPYTITGFEYELKVESLKAWPWNDVISCGITEYVTDITGTVKAAYSSNSGTTPPKWESGRYTVYLTKQTDGSWKISGLTQDSSYKGS